MPKPKQVEIPGVEVSKVPEVSRACRSLALGIADLEECRSAVDERKAVLIETMRANKVEQYTAGGITVKLRTHERLSVKHVKEAEEA